MKSWKLICTLVLALAMLCALPALAEETPEQLPSEPEQTTDAVCEADQGAHEVCRVDHHQGSHLRRCWQPSGPLLQVRKDLCGNYLCDGQPQLYRSGNGRKTRHLH